MNYFVTFSCWICVPISHALIVIVAANNFLAIFTVLLKRKRFSDLFIFFIQTLMKKK